MFKSKISSRNWLWNFENSLRVSSTFFRILNKLIFSWIRPLIWPLTLHSWRNDIDPILNKIFWYVRNGLMFPMKLWPFLNFYLETFRQLKYETSAHVQILFCSILITFYQPCLAWKSNILTYYEVVICTGDTLWQLKLVVDNINLAVKISKYGFWPVTYNLY